MCSRHEPRRIRPVRRRRRASGLRAVERVPPRRRRVRRALDLRPPRIRHLLSNERPRRDPLHEEVGRGGVPAAVRRAGLRRQRAELLRRVRRRRMRGADDDHHHDHHGDDPPARVREQSARSGRGMRRDRRRDLRTGGRRVRPPAGGVGVSLLPRTGYLDPRAGAGPHPVLSGRSLSDDGPAHAMRLRVSPGRYALRVRADAAVLRGHVRRRYLPVTLPLRARTVDVQRGSPCGRRRYRAGGCP